MFKYLKLFIFLSVLPYWHGYAMADNNMLVNSPYSSNSENPRELILLALKYEHAEGIPRNNAKAATLYCKAAKMGNADAQFFLGWMYANGRGVSKNDNIAAYLFAMAAKQGHTHAKKMQRFTPTTESSFPSCLLKPAPQRVRNLSYPKNYISRLVDKLAPTMR